MNGSLLLYAIATELKEEFIESLDVDLTNNMINFKITRYNFDLTVKEDVYYFIKEIK